MMTSKTMETSTKHRKAKHFCWIFMSYKLKKRAQFELFQKLHFTSPWKVSPVQVIIGIRTFANLIYSLNITILTRFTNFYIQVHIEAAFLNSEEDFKGKSKIC